MAVAECAACGGWVDEAEYDWNRSLCDSCEPTTCDCGDDKRPDDPSCEECMQCAVDDTLDYRAGRIGR